MRKRIAAAVALAMMTALTVGTPAFAHQGGPCATVEPDEPGHSEFAMHHIVPFAEVGGLGEGGHKPGEHRGFSLCLEVHE